MRVSGIPNPRAKQMTLEPHIETLVRLVAAVSCGALLGVNRELYGKPAGLRTQGLVALGAALATVTSYDIAAPADIAAVTRVMQGIVAGVGFLGAGVIVHGATTGEVHGLTTAALTWVSACLGIACGAGQWIAALAAVALALSLLILGVPLERVLSRPFTTAKSQDAGPRKEPVSSPGAVDI